MEQHEAKTKQLEDKGALYYEKYRDQMDLLESSVLVKLRGGISAADAYSLGKQLESFDAYVDLMEEEGISSLGQIPKIGYDVLTVSYGTNIMGAIATVQPIDEEQGIVWFKNVKASDTKGNMTAGDTMAKVGESPKAGVSYASNYVVAEASDTSVAAQVQYTFTLAQKPVRRQTVLVKLGAGAVYAKDDGNGVLLGVGMSGTITYGSNTVAASITIDLAADPGNGIAITSDYQVNIEGQDEITKIENFWDSQNVFARVYALKGTVGMLQAFGMRKRFGLAAQEELAKDLVAQINSEIGGDMIRKYAGAAVGSTQFDRTPLTGTSFAEHKLSFFDRLADAEAVLLGNAGMGTITTLIAGLSACATIQSLPGFEKMTDGTSIGSHVFGTLNGMVVIRVPEVATLDTNTVLCIYKGNNPWEAAGVYSPFMPLALTDTLPEGKNPLTSQRAAAVWAGVDVLVANFITKIVMITS